MRTDPAGSFLCFAWFDFQYVWLELWRGPQPRNTNDHRQKNAKKSVLSLDKGPGEVQQDKHFDRTCPTEKQQKMWYPSLFSPGTVAQKLWAESVFQPCPALMRQYLPSTPQVVAVESVGGASCSISTLEQQGGVTIPAQLQS